MRQKHDMVRAHTLIFNIAAAKAAGDHHRRLQGGLGGNASYGLKYDGLYQSKTGYRPTTVGKSMTSQGWSWDRVRVCVQRHTHGKSSSHSQFPRALIPSRRRHNEKAPPKCSYIMSYTTAYNHTGPGGDFYFAKYGIPVEHPANNLISHNTTEFHGTLVHNVNWDPPSKAKDGKENKEPATKRDTDPPKLPEHRGFRLLIPYDLQETYRKGMQAPTAASSGGPADSIGGPPAGEGRETEGAADARDEDRMDMDEQTTSTGADMFAPATITPEPLPPFAFPLRASSFSS